MVNKKENGRRSFLKTASIGGLLLMGTPALSGASGLAKGKKIELQKDDIILFQGDSITDGGRNKGILDANHSGGLGPTYPYLVAAALLNNFADKNLKIYNRGVGGNKVYQLAQRWDKDCLDLKPNVLSILIGVNDFLHKRNGTYDGSIKIYNDDYRKLLERTRAKLPEVKLIIAEPFGVYGVKSVDSTWHPEFDAYQEASAEIAKEFDAVYIPLQRIFNRAKENNEASYWSKDGVHPDISGHELMAKNWIEVFKG
jgi:lysophospholipase L1-like esterase